MKIRTIFVFAALSAVPVCGQAPQQIVQCRPLAPGDFLGPNDSIVGSGSNTQVCSVVMVKATAVAATAPAVPAAPTTPRPDAEVNAPTALASNPVAPPEATSAQLPAQAPAPTPRVNDGKVRLFVTDEPKDESIFLAAHRSGWQVNGNSSGQVSGSFVNGTGSINGSSYADVHGSGGSAGAAYGYSQKGADPRTVEVQADLYKKCPSVIVTNDPARADYVMLFRREGGKRSSFFAFGGLTGLALSSASKVDGASVFDTNGDMVFATRARTVAGAIKEVCGHLK